MSLVVSRTDGKGIPVAVYEDRRIPFLPSTGMVVSGTRTLRFPNAAQRKAILRDFDAAYASVPGHYRVRVA